MRIHTKKYAYTVTNVMFELVMHYWNSFLFLQIKERFLKTILL